MGEVVGNVRGSGTGIVREIKPKFSSDLENMSVEELTALRDAAEKKRREALEGAKQEALREFTEKLEALGLSIEDALPRNGPPSPSWGGSVIWRAKSAPGCRGGPSRRSSGALMGRSGAVNHAGSGRLRQLAGNARSFGSKSPSRHLCGGGSLESRLVTLFQNASAFGTAGAFDLHLSLRIDRERNFQRV